MEVIYLLLGVSVLIAISFLVVFIWSVKKHQYEDVVSPSIRILYEDEYLYKDEEHLANNDNNSNNSKINNYDTNCKY